MYVLYAPFASPSQPQSTSQSSASSTLPPPAYGVPPYYVAMQPTSPPSHADFGAHFPAAAYAAYPYGAQQLYARKELAAPHIAYSAATSPVPLLHGLPHSSHTAPSMAEYTATPPPSSRVTECKDWLKGRCMRAAACRFHHSNPNTAAPASAPASPYQPNSPLPLLQLPLHSQQHAGLAPFFHAQSAFVSAPSPLCHSPLPHALSPTPLHYAAPFHTYPPAAAPPASFAPYGSVGLGGYPSYPSYAPLPGSPSAALASYASGTPHSVYPLSPSFSTASYPSLGSSSSSSAASVSSHPSPSSVHSSSPSSASTSSSGSVPPAVAGDVCRDFQHGVCFRGAACRFLHEKQLCGDWLNHKCARAEACKFSHDKTAGPQCRDWLQGRCARGDECRYHHAHDAAEQQHEQQHEQQAGGTAEAAGTSAAPTMAATPAAAVGECRDWLKGRCLRGAACKFTHSANPLPTPGSPAASAVAVDGGVAAAEGARKRGRQPQPPATAVASAATSPPPASLPVINVTVDPALQSALSRSLQITMTQHADTGAVHITLSNAQQQPSDAHEQSADSTAPKQQPEGDSEQAASSLSREASENGVGAVPSARQLSSARLEAQLESGSEADIRGGDADEQIDQTDGAADGDVYLADRRPQKRQRRATAGDD